MSYSYVNVLTVHRILVHKQHVLMVPNGAYRKVEREIQPMPQNLPAFAVWLS